MATMTDKEMRHAVEFIPDRLYYVALSATPMTHPQRHYFSIDREMVYWNFYLDFGPLNLGHTYRFCQLLNNKLGDPKLKDKVIYFYSHSHAHKRTNAAFLICAWALMYQNKTPEEAFKPFKNYPAPFPPWHDATPSLCTFNLTILDTLKGMAKAREHRFFDFSNFNIDEYEHYEQVENGDLNWYMDGRFLGFAGPHAERETSPGGYHTLRPEDYISYFRRRNVTLVVRLNKSYYDPKRFQSQGIDHVDMYFLDGSNPPENILQKFITRCEETTGGIAVHCKAGLGRTGTCIACYIMKHYRLTAEEIIGWMRIARPGSVIGPQQHYLKEMQNRMWREGEVQRARLQSLSLPQVAGVGGREEAASGGAVATRQSESRGGRPSTGQADSNVPLTPPLNARMSRMTISGSTAVGSSPLGSGKMAAPSSGSGKMSASTGSGKSPAAPHSPGFFDVRPSSSSSPRVNGALSSYFRSPPTSAASRSPAAGRSATAAAAAAADLKEEDEAAGAQTQGDLLRARRLQNAPTSPGIGSGSEPNTPSPKRSSNAGTTGSGTPLRSSFNFLSSWKG